MLATYLSSALNNNCLCLSRSQLDISDNLSFEKLIKRDKIKWVVNCAGSAHGSGRDLFNLNAFYPMEMAKICLRLNVGFVFLSTARVFGMGEGPFSEEDNPIPYDNYGLSKYVGEQLIIRELFNGKFYIFRISMTLGTKGQKEDNQFLTRLMKKGIRGESVSAATDSKTSVVHAECVATTIMDCISSEQPNGIYHIASSDCISSYDLTASVFKKLKIDGKIFKAKASDFSQFQPTLPAIQGLVSTKLLPCGTCDEAINHFCAENK